MNTTPRRSSPPPLRSSGEERRGDPGKTFDDSIRLSDAERDAAAADLGEHFAQGRLTADEHGERLEQVWSAKTRGEVAPIFRDLPSAFAGVAARPAPAPPDRYWNAGLRPLRRGIPTPLVVVLAVLVALAVITHLPFFLLGFAVFWFVVLRHRGPRHAYAHGRHPRWR